MNNIIKVYKPKCNIGDLLIWNNDRGYITDISYSFYNQVYYEITWLEEDDVEPGFYTQVKESYMAEEMDYDISNKVYQHFPVKE
jgi:hypothetical protein